MELTGKSQYPKERWAINMKGQFKEETRRAKKIKAKFIPGNIQIIYSFEILRGSPLPVKSAKMFEMVPFGEESLGKWETLKFHIHYN